MPDKLEELLEIEGYSDVMEFLEEYAIDSVVPGICMNEECDYTCEVEPDCRDGWCEVCETQTVKSGFILAEVI